MRIFAGAEEMMRKLSLLAAVLFGMVAFASAQPDLSGTWVLVTLESNVPVPRGGDVSMVIKHTGKEWIFSRTRVAQGKVRTVDEAFTVDGLEHTDTEREFKYKGIWEGDTMVISGIWPTRNVSRKLSYALSADGKVLTVTDVIKSQKSEAEVIQVFDRK
jgi:hypothetical protein